MYPSFLGISKALHMDIFHQPLKILRILIGSTIAGH
jgi:hypothetical protein